MVAKDERERSRWVADWRASGLTADEFSARFGLSANTLRYWAYRRQKAAVVRSVELVRVERAASPAATATSGATSIVVEIGGARVIVPVGADSTTVRMVLEALRPVGGPA